MERNQNCLSYWFPLLEAAGLPIPATRILRTDLPLIELCDGKTPNGFDLFLTCLDMAAREVGGYPVFMRTGQGSGKHDWSRTCFVASREGFPSHVASLVEWSEIVDFLGLPTNVWAVRQFLHLDAPFRAFRGMPVARERRYFVRDGKVICSHFYWPDGALEEAAHIEPLPPDWRELLAALSEDRPGESEQLVALASRASLALPGAWSVDLTCDQTGKWWLTDCALAAQSFHWPGCRHAAELAATREQEN